MTRAMVAAARPKSSRPARGHAPSLGDRLDAAIAEIFPTWGARRMASRARLRNGRELLTRLSRQNEGANSDRIRGDKWLGSRLSADSWAEEDLRDLRMRVEELYRNEPYTRSYVEGRVSNEVGCGIRAQARVTEASGLSAAAAKEVNQQAEDLFEQWSRTAHVDGQQSFSQIQRAVDRDVARFGESFVVMNDREGRGPVPVVLEVIYPGRVETPPEKEGDPLVRLGVRRSPSGEIRSYYVRTTDPDDTRASTIKYREIPAYRGGQGGLQMLHIFEPQFASQSRGVTDLQPVLNQLKDLKDVTEANIIAAQVEACLVGFITTNNTPDGAAEGASAGLTPDGERSELMTPGRMYYGQQGESVTFNSPTRQSGGFEAFARWTLKSIGAGLNYCYELLCRDWSNVSYSSGRLSLIDARKTFRCRRQLLIEKLCQPVWERVFDWGVILGRIMVSAALYAAQPWLLLRALWIGDRMEWIDLNNEMKAATGSIEAGLDAPQNIMTSQGLDPEEVCAQNEAWDLLEIQRRKRKQDAEKKAGLQPEGQEGQPAGDQPAKPGKPAKKASLRRMVRQLGRQVAHLTARLTSAA